MPMMRRTAGEGVVGTHRLEHIQRPVVYFDLPILSDCGNAKLGSDGDLNIAGNRSNRRHEVHFVLNANANARRLGFQNDG